MTPVGVVRSAITFPKSSRFLVAALVVGVFVSVGFVSGCGSDDAPLATTRPLTAPEAGLLAEALFDNYEDGGATFESTTVAGPGLGSFSMRGDVDWAGLAGIADVVGATGEAPVTGVVWSQSSVGERRPSLDPVLTSLIGEVGVPVLTRPPDQEARRLDQLIAVITGLASTQRDNAQLIVQAEGSAFLRDDSLRGRDVVVLRYGKRSTYWLDRETGKMLRFEGSDSTGQYPVIVDIIERGPRSIELPPEAVPIDVASIPEIYGTLATTSP